MHRAAIVGPLARLALVVAAASGCSGASSSPPGPVLFEARAADMGFESWLPARIDVALGSTASAFQFAASASSDRGVWNTSAALTREQTLAGTASVEVGTSATALARLAINGSRLLQAESGKLDLTFGGGHTSGTITATAPEFLDGDFIGQLVVSCWVPAAALPPGSQPAGGGVTAPDGSEALVLDARFETSGCVLFKILE